MIDELRLKREEKAFENMMDSILELATELSNKEVDEDYILTENEENFLDAVDEFMELLGEDGEGE